MVIEVLVEGKELVAVDYYNPCLKLELNKSEEIEGHGSASIVWCGDFNNTTVRKMMIIDTSWKIY